MRDTPKSALWLSWILRLCRPAPAPDRGDTQVARYAIGEPQQFVAIPATGGALMRRQSAQFAAAPPPTIAAGITDHRWRVPELLVYPVPPARWTPPKRRGPPFNTTTALIAQWCT